MSNSGVEQLVEDFAKKIEWFASSSKESRWNAAYGPTIQFDGANYKLLDIQPPKQKTAPISFGRITHHVATRTETLFYIEVESSHQALGAIGNWYSLVRQAASACTSPSLYKKQVRIHTGASEYELSGAWIQEAESNNSSIHFTLQYDTARLV